MMATHEASPALTNINPLAGTDRGGRLALWNLRSFKRVHSLATPEAGPVNALAFDAGGRGLVSAASDGFARLHDLSTRAQAEAWQVSCTRVQCDDLALRCSCKLCLLPTPVCVAGRLLPRHRSVHGFSSRRAARVHVGQ